ncbi:MAG: DNA-binding transcriptional regulator [Phycisphaerae bacterium]|nr:DNA-binding transcriptional regulator [Phycisphaerae bacterium]
MKNVLIIVDTSRASGRKFLVGVEKYTSAFTNWQVFIKPPDYLPDIIPEMSSWYNMENIDGILARDAIKTENILKSKKPIVINDTQREFIPQTSTIVTASLMIGEMAAEYFLGLGFRDFGFCGFQGLSWSQKRLQGYAQTLADKGVSNIYEYKEGVDSKYQNEAGRKNITSWLKELPRPVCIFACNDDRAISILEACKIAGLSVPEEVAVLGVDNDELICNLSSPPLSSIELNFEKAGFLAAQHLDQLMQDTTEHEIIDVEPTDIAVRQSTNIFAIDDKEIINAIIFLRKNYPKPIQVEDVVDVTCLSRRELERRFRKYFKRTINKEIQELRIKMIKKMLLNSNDSICNIAKHIRFTDPEHFSRYFKNATGLSPLQFRRSMRIND